MVYNNVSKTGRFDTACREWRKMPPVDKLWEVFKTHFKTVDKYLHFIATAGSSGFHGTAHMANNADTSILAAMQANLVAMENTLDAALEHQNITPTASVTTAASNISIMAPTITAPSVSSALRYWWTHGTTINMRHNIATCLDKKQVHSDEATEGNKLGGSTNVCGGTRI
jgi:hypothetical protein